MSERPMADKLTPEEREALVKEVREFAELCRQGRECDDYYLGGTVDAPDPDWVLRIADTLAVPRLRGEEREEAHRLREFAAWVMAAHTGSLDGCEIQEKAVALGLMECVRCDGSCADCYGAIPGEDNCYRPLLAPSSPEGGA